MFQCLQLSVHSFLDLLFLPSWINDLSTLLPWLARIEIKLQELQSPGTHSPKPLHCVGLGGKAIAHPVCWVEMFWVASLPLCKQKFGFIGLSKPTMTEPASVSSKQVRSVSHMHTHTIHINLMCKVHQCYKRCEQLYTQSQQFCTTDKRYICIVIYLWD